MKSKKPSTPSKQGKAWQRRVEKQIKAENVELGHSQGKERFENVIQLALKKRPKL